jgi:hypothetical protein
MNEKFIGQLPFEIKNGIKKLMYFDSFIVICETKSICHIFELNEYYNILNHKVFEIPDNSEIFDASIIDESVYVVSQYGLTRYEIYIDSDLYLSKRTEHLKIESEIVEKVELSSTLDQLKKEFQQDYIYIFECSRKNGCGYLTARHH